MPLPGQGPILQNLAITPDGATAYTTTSLGTVYALDLSSPSSTPRLITLGSSSALPSLAISPDQAPTARFISTVNGATVQFAASGSSSPIGTIANYAWDFGDGSTQQTSSPTITHTYATSGTHTVTLTVTNSAGTSTEVTFTGQTVSNNGGPTAQTQASVTVNSTISPPRHFSGRVSHFHKPLKLYLKWKKSHSDDIAYYELFEKNKLLSRITSRHGLHKSIHLHPKKDMHHISPGYRKYLSKKFKIRAVDEQGTRSRFTRLKVH